jgi:ribosome-associated toxin RatA of RatAB toxin-antitoxin module
LVLAVVALNVASGITCSAQAQRAPGVTPGAPVPAPLPTPVVAPAPVPAGLENGKIQTSTVAHAQLSVKWGRALGIVDAPVDDVMQVVENYGGYQQFMPHFKVSKVLSQRGTSAIVYMQASLARNTMTLWAQMKVGPKPTQGQTRIIEGKMVDGNMDAMYARWEVTPIDVGRTLVAFQLLMDPKLPLPSGFVSSENEIATRKTIKALRQIVAERAKKVAVQR